MNISDLGLYIRNRRQTLDFTQQALAEVAGISVHALSDLESGKANPTLAVMNRVAEVLGMELRLEIRRADTNGGER
jgi:transcriptional regulator with XRE-family HTH domain